MRRDSRAPRLRLPAEGLPGRREGESGIAARFRTRSSRCAACRTRCATRAAVWFASASDAGRHTLVVGSTDRVAEADDRRSRRSSPRARDRPRRALAAGVLGLPDRGGAVPERRHAAAARALEREGQTQMANRLLARFHHERGQLESAARHYELAGEPPQRPRSADAELSRKKAAQLFEARRAERAARTTARRASSCARARRTVRADAYNSAIECFERGGRRPALDRGALEAGQLSRRRGWRSSAATAARRSSACSRIAVSTPSTRRPCVLLARAYQKEGHLDLAMRKVEEL